MKKLILLTVLFFSAIINFSCKDDDNDSIQNEIAQKLVGNWGHYQGEEFRPKFNFINESKVEYYTYPNGEPILEEVGDWSMEGDVLTMIYPENVVLTFVQRVTFINDNKVKFIAMPESEYDSYEGTYIREGSQPNDPIEDESYNLEITGIYKTDWCEVTSNTSYIDFEFLEDLIVESSIPTQGNNNQSMTINRDLTGDVIGVRIKLAEYDPNNLNASKGDGFGNINFKVTNNLSNSVINDIDLTAYLVSCTDIVYALEIFFHTETGEININGYYDTND